MAHHLCLAHAQARSDSSHSSGPPSSEAKHQDAHLEPPPKSISGQPSHLPYSLHRHVVTRGHFPVCGRQLEPTRSWQGRAGVASRQSTHPDTTSSESTYPVTSASGGAQTWAIVRETAEGVPLRSSSLVGDSRWGGRLVGAPHTLSAEGVGVVSKELLQEGRRQQHGNQEQQQLWQWQVYPQRDGLQRYHSDCLEMLKRQPQEPLSSQQPPLQQLSQQQHVQGGLQRAQRTHSHQRTVIQHGPSTREYATSKQHQPNEAFPTGLYANQMAFVRSAVERSLSEVQLEEAAGARGKKESLWRLGVPWATSPKTAEGHSGEAGREGEEAGGEKTTSSSRGLQKEPEAVVISPKRQLDGQSALLIHDARSPKVRRSLAGLQSSPTRQGPTDKPHAHALPLQEKLHLLPERAVWSTELPHEPPLSPQALVEPKAGQHLSRSRKQHGLTQGLAHRRGRALLQSAGASMPALCDRSGTVGGPEYMLHGLKGLALLDAQQSGRLLRLCNSGPPSLDSASPTGAAPSALISQSLGEGYQSLVPLTTAQVLAGARGSLQRVMPVSQAQPLHRHTCAAALLSNKGALASDTREALEMLCSLPDLNDCASGEQGAVDSVRNGGDNDMLTDAGLDLQLHL